MALPVTITGLSTAVAPVGPFKVAAGNYTATPCDSQATGTTTNFALIGTGANTSMAHQFFSLGRSATYVSVTVQFAATLFGSPTDNVYVEFVASDVTSGTVIGTTDQIAAASCVGSMTFTLSTPLTIASGNFCIPRVRRTISNGSNYPMLAVRNTQGNGTSYTDAGAGYVASPASVMQIKVNETVTLASDAYYFFGRDGTTATTLQAFKSTAPDTSWASIATKTGFTTAILKLDGYQASLGPPTFIEETTTTNGSPAGALAPPWVAAQTFTPASNFLLTDVSFFVATGSAGPASAYVEIRDLSVTGTVLARSATTGFTTVVGSVEAVCRLATPLSLIADHVYAALFYYVGSGAIAGVNGTTTSEYAGGVAYPPVVGSNPVTLAAASSAPLDHRIRLYSAPNVTSTIYLLVQDGTASTALATKYVSYNALTDTFLTNTETVSAAVAVTGQVAGAGASASLVVRNNGEAVAFYSGLQTKTSGTFRSRVYYRRRTALNTWSTETQVDTNAAIDNNFPVAILGASDQVHFVWANPNSAYRTLSAANALNTGGTSASALSPVDGVSYNRAGTTKVVFISGGTTQLVGRFDSSDNPTTPSFITATSAVNTSNPHRVGVDTATGDVTIVYRNAGDSDLYAIKSTDDGATFGTAVSFFVGTVAAVDTNVSRSSSGSMYVRGGYPVVGYVVNDNGTWKYNENIVRGTSDAWNVIDKSTNVTLSNSDKTATFGVTSGVRSTQSRLNGSAGKYYAEYLIGSGGSTTWVGIQTISGVITNAASSIVAANYPSGTIYVSGSTTGVAIGGFAPNDVISVAVDLGAELIWFRKNGGIWNNNASANPATGTNGISFSALANETSFLSGISNGAAVITLRTEVADYTQQGPVGFNSWMGEVILQPSIANAWNINDKNPSITLSNADKTATGGVGTTYGVRSTTERSSGKYYIEYVYDSSGGSQNILGFKNSAGQLNLWSGAGADQFSIMWASGTNCYWYVNGTQTALVAFTAGSPVAGDILSVAWDADTKQVWGRFNNGPWNYGIPSADPATGVGGVDVSSVAGTDFKLWSLTNTNDRPVTVRTEKTAYTQTTPSGFLSWMGETLIVLPVEGTGTLTAQSATTVAPGKSEWIGTGALTATTFPSRTNFITQSQTFDNAAWARFGTNVQSNIAFSPPFDFTVTAEILETANATNEAHRILQTVNVTPNSPYTFSVYAKTSITSWLQLFYDGFAQNYNLATGTLGNNINGGSTATITSVGNGWYRCTLSMTVGGSAQVYPNIVLIDSDIAQLIPSFSNASCAITIWGAQFEAGSVATAYIPTTTTAVSDPKGVGKVSWNATGALSASTTRTNLLPYSQAFDTSWSKSGSVVIAANAVSAPDGSITAEVVADTATLEHHIIYPGVFPTGLNGKPISFSVYAQANSLTWLQLFHNGAPPGTQNFNLSNGTLGGSTGSLTPAIQYVGSGWYRCSISFTSLAEAPPLYIALKATDEVGLATYLGTGKSLYLWGAQQELSLTPTTYIPTGATAVTVTDGASLSATGTVVTPPATGTGVLTTGVAALVSSGTGISTGTGTLSAIGNLASSNYASWSQDIDNAAWTKQNVTIGANAAAAPDGSMTAESVTSTALNGPHLVAGAAIATPSGTVTASIYAKAGTGQWVQLYDPSNKFANFDLINGVTGNDTGDVTARITAVGNGWYRCSITFDKTLVYNCRAYACILNTNSPSANPSHTSVLSIYLWGAQLEMAAQASAYLPTQGTVPSFTYTTLIGTGISQFIATGVLNAVAFVGTGATNYALQSETLNVSWNPASVTVAANVAVAPNSTMTAERVTDDTASASHYIYQDPILADNGRVFTYSIYAKAETLSWLQLAIFFDNAYVNFNLATGVIGNSSGVLSSQIVAVGNGWYRCSITRTTVGGANDLFIQLSNGNPSAIASYTGTGTGSLLLWGVQVELGSTPTTYIPTTTVPVTGPAGGTLVGSGSVITPPAIGTGALVAGAAFIIDRGTTVQGNTSFGEVGAYSSYGTTFVAASSRLTSASFYVGKGVAGADGLVVNVFGVSGTTPVPPQIGASSNLIPASSLPVGSTTEITFDFAPINLTVGTTYSLIVVRTGAADSANYYLAGFNSINTYADGQFLRRDSSGIWSTFASYDLPGKITFSNSGEIASSGTVVSTGTAILTASNSVLVGTGAVSSAEATGTGALLTSSVSATNIALQSETLNVAPWGLNAATITANAFAAPNSSNTAERLVDDATNGVHYVYQFTIPITAGVPYTYSVYAKAETLSWFQFYLGNGWANFNVAAGSIGYIASGSSANIVAIGNGWYRCSVTYTKATGTTNDIALVLANSDINGFPTYTGTGSGSLLLWGMQVELGSTPTAYIPTTTAAVTATASPLYGSGTVVTLPATGTGALVATPFGVTNLFLQSQTLNVWSISSSSLTVDAITAPDGTTTAEMVTDAVAANFHGVGQSGPLVGGTPYSVSVYAKAGTLSWLQLATGLGPKTANFDLVNGVTGKVSSGVTSQITAVGGGWYRCSMVFSPATTYADMLYLYLAPNDITGVAFYTGSGTGTLYLWGAQLQLGSTTTEYIPTTSTTDTRTYTLVSNGISGSIGSGAGGAGADVVIAGSFVGNLAVGSTGNPKVAQGFVAAGTSITKVQFKGLYVSGTIPTDEVQVKIFTVDASHNPLTQVGVTSNLVPASSLNTTPSIVDFTFASAVPVSDGVEYVFVLERTGAPNSTSPYYINLVSSAYGGTTVCYRQYNGTTWSAAFGGAYDIDSVVTHGAVVGGLLAASSTIVGTGAGVAPEATGTGTLSAQSSTLSSAGISQSRSTSAVLNSQNSTLAGVALSTSLSTVAALVAPNRTMAGAAVSTSLGTATIIAPNRTMVGTGVGASTGTGALVPSVSTINGSVASLRAVISWVRLTATQVTITVSSGPLAVVEAADTPSFVGTVVNRGTLTVVEAADTPSFAGTVVNRGTLTVVEATDTTSFVGTVIGAGTGVLTSPNSTVVSSGLSASTGTGVLASTTSTVVSSGKSISTGTGVLISTSTLASSGTVAWRGTGVLTSTNCASVGLGVSASIGTGALASTTSTIVSSGTVAWRGTGVLISTSSTIVSLGVATSFATLAVIEAPDIAIFVASGISSGLLTVVEPPDTATFVGKTSSTGTGALTSTSTLAGLGEATSKGALVVSEASDTAVIAGSVFHKATLVATEASDTPVIIGTVVNRGTLAVTEANDNAVLVGTVVNNGTLVATEASDTAVIVGTVVNRGTLAAIEGADIAIFVTAGISSGVLTVVEAADTANFNGTVVNRGTLTVVEAADTPSFAGTVVNRGTLTVVEANDNAVIVGKVVNNGALVALETPDTAVFAGTVLRRVSSAAALFIAA